MRTLLIVMAGSLVATALTACPASSVGRRRTTHHLSRVGGRWKVDLAANPDLKRRIGALRPWVALAIQRLQAAAATLERQLAPGPAPKRQPTGHVDPKRD